MATWIVGGVLVVIVGAIVWKMISDKRSGKGGCACGDCSECHGACAGHAGSPEQGKKN